MQKSLQPIDDDYWNSILETIDIRVIPFDYLKNIVLYFENGDEWDIDLEGDEIPEDFKPKSVGDLLDAFGNELMSIDFAINIDLIREESYEALRNILNYD